MYIITMKIRHMHAGRVRAKRLSVCLSVCFARFFWGRLIQERETSDTFSFHLVSSDSHVPQGINWAFTSYIISRSSGKLFKSPSMKISTVGGSLPQNHILLCHIWHALDCGHHSHSRWLRVGYQPTPLMAYIISILDNPPIPPFGTGTD